MVFGRMLEMAVHTDWTQFLFFFVLGFLAAAAAMGNLM